jgi:hypothetical protein
MVLSSGWVIRLGDLLVVLSEMLHRFRSREGASHKQRGLTLSSRAKRNLEALAQK